MVCDSLSAKLLESQKFCIFRFDGFPRKAETRDNNVRAFSRIGIGMNTKKMEVEKTLDWMKVYIGYAYLCATIPIRFDPGTKTLVFSNSRRYSIAMGLMVLQRCAVVIFLVRDILNHKIGFQDKFDILQLAITLVSFFCIGNHLHNFWRGPEIVSTINSFLLYYKDFQRRPTACFIICAGRSLYLYLFVFTGTGRTQMLKRPGPRKQHFYYNLYLQVTFLGLIANPLGCTLYYLESCRGHFFSGVLPICQKVNGTWEHVDWPSPFYLVGLCSLQFLIVTECICACFLNVGVIYFLIFGSQQIFQDLK